MNGLEVAIGVLVILYHVFSFVGSLIDGGRAARTVRRRRARPRKTRKRRASILRMHLGRGRMRGVTEGWLVTGEHRDREVTLGIPGPGVERATTAQLHTDCDLRLRVAPNPHGGPYDVELEGDETAQARAAAALRSPAMKSALGALFGDLGVTGLRVAAGEVSLEYWPSDIDLAPPRVDRVLDLLRRVAKACERAAEAPLVTHVELRAAASKPGRCPYCRDALDPAQEAVVACADCHTEHHAECFDELGRCTTLGCESPRSRPVLLAGEADAPPVLRIRLDRCEQCGSRRRGCTPDRCRAPRNLRDRQGRGSAQGAAQRELERFERRQRRRRRQRS